MKLDFWNKGIKQVREIKKKVTRTGEYQSKRKPISVFVSNDLEIDKRRIREEEAKENMLYEELIKER